MSSHVFKIATQEPELLLEAVTSALGESSRVARQVREQMPKPVVEEPEAFGSIVRAVCPFGTESQLWQRSYGEGKHYWESENGVIDVWSDLTHVEVLRVGIGGPEPLAQWETDLLNEQEVRDVASAVLSAMDVDQYLIDAVTNARPR